jgi:hypothetical protein
MIPTYLASAAVLTSFVITCKRLGNDPFAYLRDVIDRISAHPQNRLAELLHDRWKTAHPPDPLTDLSAHLPYIISHRHMCSQDAYPLTASFHIIGSRPSSATHIRWQIQDDRSRHRPALSVPQRFDRPM